MLYVAVYCCSGVATKKEAWKATARQGLDAGNRGGRSGDVRVGGHRGGEDFRVEPPPAPRRCLPRGLPAGPPGGRIGGGTTVLMGFRAVLLNFQTLLRRTFTATFT